MNSKFENISIFQLDEHSEKSENDKNKTNLLNVPLAQRLKPSSLEDYVGQEHILSEEKLLYRAIKSDRLTSIILYGPPGTGKTSLAQVIAKTTKSNFIELNAVTSGLKDLREVIDVASTNLIMKAEKTIVFIDEIHRFNKSQQDALLPHVEKGTIILIGATTENPFFEVNKALLSRSMMFKLEPLSENNIKKIIYNALNDKKLGYGNIKINLSEEALSFICENSNGDARRALNALELGVLTTSKNSKGIINIDLKIIEECMQKKYITYDKNGDSHYDVISAFIKSMRGSDADAAIHYLARMLYAGEEPEFIARRVLIAASEDVGNADPYALLIANAALNAVKTLGMPEARITLAQAVTYISTAPKSNASYVAINKALEDVEKKKIAQVPIHLRDKSYNGSSSLGNGVDYKYPHSFQEHYVKQQYMPEELIDTVYYNPTGLGYEKRIKERITNLNKVK